MLALGWLLLHGCACQFHTSENIRAAACAQCGDERLQADTVIDLLRLGDPVALRIEGDDAGAVGWL